MPANLRVLVASEQPPVRRLLKRVVEAEPGVAIAAEANSESEAVALAREVKPDIALLDFHLPHRVGVDWVRLSRISGLDAAQVISEEVPGARVVLLTNLDVVTWQKRDLAGGLAIEKGGISRSLTLRELCFEAVRPGAPVLVDVDLRRQRRSAKRRKLLNVFLGAVLAAVGAWMVTGTILFVLLLFRLLAG